MQIQYLKHQEIDQPRWLQTIQRSKNGLIYAWPQYLNIISPGWHGLVAEDYSLVMPLTHRSKWGIDYLYQPAFCQQLGVFGNSIEESIIEQFIEKAAKQFRFSEIQLNYLNHFSSQDNGFIRKNYVLSLQNDYETIRNGYGKDLIKKNLLRTEKFKLQYQSSDNFNSAISTFENLYSVKMTGNKPKDYLLLQQLATRLHGTGNAFVREVRLPNGELLACGVFLKDERRIYNIASSTLPNGRTLEANHFLFDQLIQEFAGSGLLLDFEGSEVQGIERFYKKFGSYNQPYYTARWNTLPWPIHLLKK